jgi:hypothetical protein
MATGFFSPEELKSPEALAMRQKLALAMMAREGKYPTTIGAGITELGRAVGDRFTQQRLEAQMAALERASAARGAGAAAAPTISPAVPGRTDPASGASSAAPAATNTASAFPDVDTSATTASIPAATLTDVAQAPPPEVATAPPPVQDASVAPPVQVAQADTGTVSDAPPVGGQPAAQPNVRDALAQQVMMQQRPGGPPQNPLLAAGQSPAAMPSTLGVDPALLGSPARSAENRPIVPDFVRMAQAGGIKPSSAPIEPIPPATPATPPDQMPFRKPTFEAPPRMADPGAREIELMRAANDPMVLPSYQKLYAAEAARLADKRKLDYDQAIKAFEPRTRLMERDQERAADADRKKMEMQKLADEAKDRDYNEKIKRLTGGRPIAQVEEGLYKSRASVGSVPAIAAGLARTNAVVDKMYTGPTADVNTFLSQLLPQTPWGFDPAKGTATQQFRSAISDIRAAHRTAVTGPGAVSNAEQAALDKATAADPKLNIDTIKEALVAAESIMRKTAIAHQKEVHNYAGNFDPDRVRSVFGTFGVPNMADIVPQRHVNKLMTFTGDTPEHKAARSDFDETYHTPGLADELIRQEMLRQQRRR